MILENCTYITPLLTCSKGNFKISDGCIQKITQKPIRPEPNEEVISGTGKLLIPGLMNLHTHAAMSLFKGYADDLPLHQWLTEKIFPVEAKLTSEAVYYGSLLAIAEMLHNGCTFFNDMYFFCEETAKAIECSGIRAILSPGLTDQSGEKRIQDIAEFFYNFNHSAKGRIQVFFGPHAPYTCSLPFLEKIAKKAQELKTGIHIHLHETQKEITDFKEKHNGCTPIEEIEKTGLFSNQTIGAHCVYLSNHDQEILSRNKVLVVHNPSSNLKLASGIAPIQQYIQNGIPVALGTDGASSNNQLNMFFEMHIASLLGKVAGKLDPTSLSAETTFQMATSVPGKWLFDNPIGIIQENAIADLVFLDTDSISTLPALAPISNLVYSSTGIGEVNTVIIQGKCVMKNRKILTFDEDVIRTEASKIASDITGIRSYAI